MIIRRFINQLMQSNCYVLSKNGRCIIVDPASEKSEDVIQFVEDENLVPDFIILTHEHSDHTWGVNALLEYCPSIRVLTCKACTIELPKAWQSYFKFYYDDPEYIYYVGRRVAELKGVPAEQVFNAALKNTKTLFSKIK